MRTGRYSMADLFGSRNIEQLVIPEIQRDYVWQSEQVMCFLESILANFIAWQKSKEHPAFEVISAANTDQQASALDLKTDFAEFYAKRFHTTNIGFVYAYNDSDLPCQYYLIDGQQRLTTIFLTLLATAASSDSLELKERFQSRYCMLSTATSLHDKSVKAKLDYRLRELTSEFFHRCIPFLLKNPSSVTDLKDQSWYRKQLDEDITVKNLISNFAEILKHLNKAVSPSNAQQFYGYLEEFVDCWYFDVNESAQGETLYLYLNARGETTATNENLKAQLLVKVQSPEVKSEWGKRWEDWQDFFWQRRQRGIAGGINPNADRGFDCFLSCVKNLEHRRARDGSQKAEITAEVIDKYFRCLEWLELKKETFKKFYTYAEWIDSWFNEAWRIINNPVITDWGVNLSDPNKSKEHNQMVLVWGTFLSVACSFERANGIMEDIDIMKVFRTIRIFWLRYKNFNRSVTSLPVAVNEFLFVEQPKFNGSESQEEKDKWILLKDKSEPERCEFESAIWKIEDHPLNINGAYLGSLNISHLLELDPTILTLGKLDEARKSFYELFPLNVKNTDKRIAQALLYYGVFWQQVSPWYYNNYTLGEWRLTVRGKGGEELKSSHAKGTVFRSFFEDFIRSGASLDEFLKQKCGTELIDPATTEIRKALIWYSEKTGNAFLSKGWHVALSSNGEKDKYLPGLDVIWNLPRYFQGDYQKMADQVSQLHQ